MIDFNEYNPDGGISDEVGGDWGDGWQNDSTDNIEQTYTDYDNN